MEKLYIVIPSYNEEETIEKVIDDWYPVVEKISKDSRLVIFDASSDETPTLVKKMSKTRPQLILESRDKIGHGPTVHMAYKYCIEAKADYIFQTDADDQTRASEFLAFWNERKEYDAIIGHRNHRKDGFFRYIVTKTLKLVLRIIFKISVTDANTPYRLMNTKLVKKYLDNIPPKFNLPNVMLTVMFLKGKEKVKFIPITFEDRQGGKNKLNLKGIFKIGIQAVKDFKEMRRLLKYDQK